jgi:hypothetical protein
MEQIGYVQAIGTIPCCSEACWDNLMVESPPD